MNTKNALVVRTNRFDSSRNALTRSAPPSMMVMQQLVGALTKMNEKIDALTLQQTQMPEVRYPRPIQVNVRQVDRGQEETLPKSQPKKTRYSILKEKLLDQFE